MDNKIEKLLSPEELRLYKLRKTVADRRKQEIRQISDESTSKILSTLNEQISNTIDVIKEIRVDGLATSTEIEQLKQQVSDIAELVEKTDPVSPIIDRVSQLEEVIKKKDFRGPRGPQGEKGERGEDGKSIIGPKGGDGKDGKDGRDGLDGKNGSPDTPEEIKLKLETLKGKERLNVSAIDGIEQIASGIALAVSKDGGITNETDPVWNSEKINYYTKLEGDATFHPLEDQRLSTTDNVSFNTVNGGILSGNNTGDQDLTPFTSHILNVNNPHQTSDANLITSDITTNNSSVSKHGFLPKLSGSATQYLNGQGNWASVSGGSGLPAGYSEVSFTGQTSVNVLHNFGVKPLVQVLDGDDEVLISFRVIHNTDNDLTVEFDATTSGTIILSAGREVPNVITVSADYSITTNDNIVISSASDITITLPTAIGQVGKQYTIDNASNGDIIITGTETIQGLITAILPSNSSVVVYSNNINWRFT